MKTISFVGYNFYLTPLSPPPPHPLSLPLLSVPDSMSAILVPIWGAVVDRFGGRVLQLVLSSLAIAIVHLLLSLTMINPIFPLILLGLSYSVYGVAIWPSIALVVQHQQRLEQEDRHQQRQQQPRWRRIHEDEEEVNTAAAERRPLLLRSSSSSSSSSSSASETETGESHATSRIIGTAYGISTSALNTSLTLFPLITAQIRVSGGSFTHVLLFFVGLALLGAMASVYLWRLDSRSGFVLQLPQKFEEEEEDKVEHEDREREEET